MSDKPEVKKEKKLTDKIKETMGMGMVDKAKEEEEVEEAPKAVKMVDPKPTVTASKEDTAKMAEMPVMHVNPAKQGRYTSMMSQKPFGARKYFK